MTFPVTRIISLAILSVLLQGCMTYQYRQVQVEITNGQTGKPHANVPIRVSMPHSESMRWPAGSFANTDADGRAVIRMFTSSAGKLDLHVGDEAFVVRNMAIITGGEAEPVKASELKVVLSPAPAAK